MLSQDDRRRLAEIERLLEQDDPVFAERMRGAPARRPGRLSLLLWILVALIGTPLLAGLVSGNAAVTFALIVAASFVVLWWLPRHMS